MKWVSSHNKLNKELSAIPLLGIYAKEPETHVQTKAGTRTSVAASFTIDTK